MRVQKICGFVLSVALASPGFASTPDAAPTPARVAYPGGLDRTFGNAGRAPAPADARILLPVEWEAVAIQSDGKIVVVGNTSDSVVVARYDASGILDAGFGSAGVVTPILPYGGQAKALALTGRGEIVVVGKAYRAPDLDTGTDIFALRLRADGSLDARFAGGVVTFDLGERDDATAVVSQGNERILILADANRRYPAMPSGAVVLLGLRNDGALDPTFGRDGSTHITGAMHEIISAGAITQEPDGRFFIAFDAGEPASRRLHVIRLGENGDPLQSFDVVAGQARDIGRLSDGKVIVHGYSGTGATALFRFMGNGSLDPGFGDDGILALYELRAGRIVVDKNDRVIVATGSEVVRRHANGNLDITFGVEGFATTPGFSEYDNVALQADGKIVAVGGGCFHNLPHGVTCTTSVDRYEADRTQICGDADANGAFSVSDGVATLRAAAGLDSVCSATVCDVDGSGSIGVTDGVNVLRAAADLHALLSCGIEGR
jgi:uncharacterized delta-60 repeat protein